MVDTSSYMDIRKREALLAKRAKWDERFANLTLEVATWSKDPNKQVGALLVSPDRTTKHDGYNGLPRCMPDSVELLADREAKEGLVLHAELNAILNACCNLRGWTIYVTSPPCVHCASTLLQVGIARVVCPPLRPESRWYKQHIKARDNLIKYGVEVTFLAKLENDNGSSGHTGCQC